MAPITQQPELYGISSIDKGQYPDFNLSYSYTVSSGLNTVEADELSRIYADRIARKYRSKKFFKLNLESLLVYLSHFENSDPSLLRPVPSANSINSKFNQPPTLKSIPRIKRNVMIDKLRFNIVDIMNNTHGDSEAVYPSETCVIVDPVLGRLQSISPQIIEVLNLFDGRKNVQQVVRELSSKYNVAQEKVEKDCISLLTSLFKEGYIVF